MRNGWARIAPGSRTEVGAVARGWTLTEIIVVATIVGILAGVSVPTYIGYVRRARLDSARSLCEMIAAAAAQAHQNGSRFANCGPDNFGGDAQRWEDDLGLKRSPDDGAWTFSYGCPEGVDLGRNFVVAVRPDQAGPLRGAKWLQQRGATGYYYPYRNVHERWDGFFKE